MTAKYRVIKRDGSYPYKIEKKTFLFWHQIDMERTAAAATEKMIDLCAQDNTVKYGTVMATYSAEDLTVDKLKGNK